MIRSFPELLALWTPQQLARLLGVPKSTAATAQKRGSLHARHWSKIIRLAAARGETITATDLLRFYDQVWNPQLSDGTSRSVSRRDLSLEQLDLRK